MAFLRRWSTARQERELRISAPDQVRLETRITHDEATQKLQGLPLEWVQVLRDSGIIGEDLVLLKKPKPTGLYNNGLLNLSKSSLLSNSSLKKLWREVSGKSKRGSLDADGAPADALRTLAIEGNATDNTPRTQGSPSMPQEDTPISSIDASSPDITQSAFASRQSTFNTIPEADNGLEQIRQDYGLPFHHRDYQDISPNLFEVVDSLGHGSLGVVEEVRVSPYYSSFVRKRVQIPYYKRKQYLKIIGQEAQVLQNLSHCHIVKMIGSYSEVPDTGRQFYSLLMAPVGQRDLKTFLDMMGDKATSHPSEWYEDRKVWLRNWFKCLSSALAYIHRKGVRHQDIKPSNIIHRRSAIYFTDFSSASQFQIGQTTSTENPARTSAMYAAPEVINSEEDGLSRHGRGTDVFALGAVFTEMLAVLRGSSIDEYQHSLMSAEKGHDISTAARPTFLYGRKMKEIEYFFGEDGFFESCIANMLLPDRDQRPDANEVASQIRNYQPWILRGCSCDADLP